VKNVEIKNNIAHINVDDRDKVSVIGIRGKNIKKAKILAKRHHKINDIVIT
jgi:N utilization substance protein A